MEPPDEDEEPTVGTSEGKVTFVLEEAPVELGKVGKSMTILNSDEHAEFLKKHGKDPAQYRPDIAHQTLLAVLDSPLNKAGYVEAIFMKTTGNALVSISPNTRLPRTFKRFCGLMGTFQNCQDVFHPLAARNRGLLFLTAECSCLTQCKRCKSSV